MSLIQQVRYLETLFSLLPVLKEREKISYYPMWVFSLLPRKIHTAVVSVLLSLWHGLQLSQNFFPLEYTMIERKLIVINVDFSA